MRDYARDVLDAALATGGEVQRLPLPLQFRVAPEPLWLIRPPPQDAAA